VTDSSAQPDRQPSAIGDAIRFDEIAEQAQLAASLWGSIVLAAERRSHLIIRLHIKQLLAVTAAVVETVDELETSHGQT
jgi:hypothetical protein